MKRMIAVFSMLLSLANAQEHNGEIIVKYKTPLTLKVTGYAGEQNSILGVTILKPEQGLLRTAGYDIFAEVAKLKADPNVEYAEPNYVYRASDAPNDPRYSSLYGMTITHADSAWKVTTGKKSVLVAVIDTGVDYNHEDLAGNVFVNSKEIANNHVDEDGNGYIDDVHGWDFANNDNNPMDDNEHGTHVSGTIGAVGNNGKGVVGVNWQVSILPCKFLDSNGSGTSADAAEAIMYSANMGAVISSNSWGGGGQSLTLENAIKYANSKGMLVVAAAGNESSNNDNTPSYPANYNVANVISVAATDSQDKLASFSNYGATKVHLAAPGVNILSSTPNNQYQSFSGTSMATPHVSGALALMRAANDTLSAASMKAKLLASVDNVTGLTGKVSTGGRLNVEKCVLGMGTQPGPGPGPAPTPVPTNPPSKCGDKTAALWLGGLAAVLVLLRRNRR